MLFGLCRKYGICLIWFDSFSSFPRSISTFYFSENNKNVPGVSSSSDSDSGESFFTFF